MFGSCKSGFEFPVLMKLSPVISKLKTILFTQKKKFKTILFHLSHEFCIGHYAVRIGSPLRSTHELLMIQM